MVKAALSFISGCALRAGQGASKRSVVSLFETRNGRGTNTTPHGSNRMERGTSEIVLPSSSRTTDENRTAFRNR
jgi:hypothetical protein